MVIQHATAGKAGDATLFLVAAAGLRAYRPPIAERSLFVCDQRQQKCQRDEERERRVGEHEVRARTQRQHAISPTAAARGARPSMPRSVNGRDGRDAERRPTRLKEARRRLTERATRR